MGGVEGTFQSNVWAVLFSVSYNITDDEAAEMLASNQMSPFVGNVRLKF